jgi:biopolymer transport protein ExbB
VLDQPLLDVRDLFDTGGDVLFLIGAVLLMMWTLMLERFWYFWKVHPEIVRETRMEWRERPDRSSWYAHQIRRLLISKVSVRLAAGIPMIRTLVALCPLLGLLGTVTGMIEVFDVMAVAGNANPRAMASGVTRATIPTMAGMVAALSGLALSVQLERYASQETERVSDHLTHS